MKASLSCYHLSLFPMSPSGTLLSTAYSSTVTGAVPESSYSAVHFGVQLRDVFNLFPLFPRTRWKLSSRDDQLYSFSSLPLSYERCQKPYGFAYFLNGVFRLEHAFILFHRGGQHQAARDEEKWREDRAFQEKLIHAIGSKIVSRLKKSQNSNGQINRKASQT